MMGRAMTATVDIAVSEIRRVEGPAYSVEVHIAGDSRDARRLCAAFCMRGLCVSVIDQEFIYTGGRETGVRVLLVNYPRLPSTKVDLFDTACALAETLLEGLHQHSALVVAPDRTLWLTRRAGN